MLNNHSTSSSFSLSLFTATVIAVRALMCLALICTLIGWGLSMVALVIHKPRFLFSAGMAFLLQSILTTPTTNHYFHTFLSSVAIYRAFVIY